MEKEKEENSYSSDEDSGGTEEVATPSMASSQEEPPITRVVTPPCDIPSPPSGLRYRGNKGEDKTDAELLLQGAMRVRI